jgi:ribosomal protein S18 acetylase RimI-like enzyme
MNVDFRQAKKSDIEFLTDLRMRTMNIHLKKVGWPLDEQSHLDRILYRFDAAKIVSVENTDVGLLKSYCDKLGWNIVQIQISPEYQGKGIGSKIIRNILEQAEGDGLDVTLSVLKGNPAKELYRKLGFVTVSESDAEYTMCVKSNNQNQTDKIKLNRREYV